MKYPHIFLIAFIFWLLASCKNPKSSQTSYPEVDALFTERIAKDEPGCALAIIRDGEITYQKGYGMANLDYEIPLSPSSVFRIASVSKQVTAACIHLLAQEGKLSLDDDIRKYFPDLPDYGYTITIRHMIHHTSGLRDYVNLFYLAGFSDDDHYSDEELLQMIFRQKALNFPPGEEFLYCNSGYFLLGQIVGQVSGQNLRAFAEENIFQPLGMTHTHYHNNHKEVVPDRAMGYSPTKEGYEVAVTTLDMIGDGGIFTTVGDYSKWGENYDHHKVGGEKLYKAMVTRGILNNGDTLTYASGIDVDRYRGLLTFSHGGSWVGYRTYFLHFPEEKLSIIIFANLSSLWPGGLAWEVADIVLVDKLAPRESFSSPQPEPEEKVEIPAPFMAGLEGTYYSEELDAYYTISREKDVYQFHAPRLNVSPILTRPSGDMLIQNWITLEVDKVGADIRGLNMGADRVKNIYLEKL